MSQTTNFKQLLMLLAKKTNYELDAFELRIILQDLSDIPPDALNASLLDFYKSSQSGARFPSLNEIRAKCARISGTPESGSDDSPANIADRMWAAISKFGYTNPKSAAEYIGPIGWNTILRQGGWVSFCQGVSSDQKSFLIPQWRKSLESDLESSRLKSSLNIIQGTRSSQPQLLSSLVNQISTAKPKP